MFGKRGVQIKTPEQIKLMRRAGLVVGETLQLMRESVRAGITTGELDAIAEDNIRSAGAVPSFLGYMGFTGSICTSINQEVVHGIPGERVLNPGDLISIDCGAIVDGWHGDAATSLIVPGAEPSDEVRALMRTTEGSLWAGIGAARLGGRVSDISHAVEQHILAQGNYGILEDYTGHGIGTEMHQPPNVPNYGRPGTGPKLVKGLALAVEPMVALGSQEAVTLEDDWTVVTLDQQWAAHYEHTFTLTDQGAWVLTALDGGESMLAQLGVPFGPLTD